MSQKRHVYISKCQLNLHYEIKQSQGASCIWNSDIYTAKLLEQSRDGFGPGQQALSQAFPGFNLEFSKGPGLAGSLYLVTSLG